MSIYPKDAGERQRMRAAARRELLARAEVEAKKYGRSIKCGNWSGLDPDTLTLNHADVPGGCANDGSGCLCECHDPPT